MRISVASGLHGQTGNSTVALVTAHALSLLLKSSVCLTHADFGNPTLSNCLGVEFVDDVTRSLSHVTKLLKNNMLQPEEVPDYALKVFDGLDLYSTSKITLDMGELLAFFEFLLAKMTVYNHIVIDVDAGLRSDISRLAMSVSDVLIIPVTHNQTVITESIKFRDSVLEVLKKMRRRRELRICYLLNHYHPEIGTYKSVAAKLGVKPQQMLTLHYNTDLIKSSNTGKLSDTLSGALAGKGGMLKLRGDMNSICQAIVGKDVKLHDNKGGKKDNREGNK